MKIRHNGLYLCAALSGLVLTAAGCSATKKAQQPTEANPTIHMTPHISTGKKPAAVTAPVYIYKMKKDYSQQVPVTMDATRTKVVSYPAPTDLKLNGRFAYPTPLENGFWLDNRGIDRNVAFLSYTYEEYSRLPEAPVADTLLKYIIDKDPLTEIHYCGRRGDYKNIVEELNELIRQKYK